MNLIPVYAVTGFLDAGKTTCINRWQARPERRKRRILTVQFEEGQTSLAVVGRSVGRLAYAKRDWERRRSGVAEELGGFIRETSPDEIWVEWNGVISFSELLSFLLMEPLRRLCYIRKVVHVADAARIGVLLGKTGDALPEQIANSDVAVVRGAPDTSTFRLVRRTLRALRPGLPCVTDENKKKMDNMLDRSVGDPIARFFVCLLLGVILLGLWGAPANEVSFPLSRFVNIFLGTLLQALPFLLLGVLFSSAIQVFVPQGAIERRFPKSVVGGMLAAVVGGFCLPVCDCASIPVFRSLIRKGVPLPAAVTFLMVSPVINPVVILSTTMAFEGTPVVAARVGGGLAAALLVGLSFVIWPAKNATLSGALGGWPCGCGCFGDAPARGAWQGKAGLFVRHSKAEFFDVGKYLMSGAFVSSIFQILDIERWMTPSGSAGLFFATALMMALAFLLSLCSSSDAVVARGFAAWLPMGAVLGFLVFGPMMDIKNMAMLSAGFSKRFVVRLLVFAFAACLLVALILGVRI